MVQHKPHLCGIVSHRLGRNDDLCEFTLVISIKLFPFTDIVREHASHDVVEVGRNLPIQFRVMNPPIGRADGDRRWVIQCAHTFHLHNGNPAVFRHGKLRSGKRERRVVILDAQSGRALAGNRPAAGHIGKMQQNGFFLLHPGVVHDGHLEALLEFPRQKDQGAGDRLVIVPLIRGAIGGGVIHAQNPVGWACTLDGHDRVRSQHIFTDIKVHVGELKLAVVIPYDKLDLVPAHFTSLGIRHNIAAPVHSKNPNLNILRELQLGIVQRNKRHLDSVDPCRDDHFAPQILVVGNGTGCAVHPKVHGYITNRTSGHHRSAGHHTAAITTGVLIIATKPGEALFRQTSGITLERVQHAVQRRDVERPVGPDDRLRQRGATDIDLIEQFTV